VHRLNGKLAYSDATLLDTEKQLSQIVEDITGLESKENTLQENLQRIKDLMASMEMGGPVADVQKVLDEDANTRNYVNLATDLNKLRKLRLSLVDDSPLEQRYSARRADAGERLCESSINIQNIITKIRRSKGHLETLSSQLETEKISHLNKLAFFKTLE
jgi:chromosome segregation ATPase